MKTLKFNEQVQQQLIEHIDRIDETLETKAVVKAVVQRMDTFEGVEHNIQIRDYFLPKIKRFSDMIDQLLSDNKHVKETVR